MADRRCIAEGCDLAPIARGMCQRHWHKWRRAQTDFVSRKPQRDPVCTVDGCDRPHSGRGYCTFHLHRFRWWGDPLHNGIRHTEDERFFAKVAKDPETGCWNWTASLNGHGGYATFKARLTEARALRGTGDRTSLMVLAHRWAHERWKGEIPEHFHVDHLCGSRRCVNPDHLEAVAPVENWRRGRARYQARMAQLRAQGGDA